MNSNNLSKLRSSPSTLILSALILTFSFLLTSVSAIAEINDTESIPAHSQWINQLGSTLTISTIDSSGLLTGSYVNKAAGYPCQDTAYPVTGWVDGTAIVFNTLWINSTESCNSITAWTGFYYNDEISTLWQLVSDGATSTSEISSGSDTFTQKSSTSALPKLKK
ncbi:avidin/streptavidin family protein [bacterium]|nr:avidin/streptavidin family protein [bacterium]